VISSRFKAGEAINSDLGSSLFVKFDPAPAHPSPPNGEVHVWRADLEDPGWPNASGLPPDERARANRFLRSSDRLRWVAARWALRGVLGRYLEQEPGEIELARGERGKPRLAEAPERLEFNLSHSGPVALVAVCGTCAVGVDVERVETGRDLVQLAARALQPEDAAAVRAATGAERVSIFYERWARHEAALKCLGRGLGAPRGDAVVAIGSLPLGSGYAGAVAIAGMDLPPLRCWTLGPPLPEDG
jgi:4'-phosphopantetheinyl transferase